MKSVLYILVLSILINLHFKNAKAGGIDFSFLLVPAAIPLSLPFYLAESIKSNNNADSNALEYIKNQQLSMLEDVKKIQQSEKLALDFVNSKCNSNWSYQVVEKNGKENLYDSTYFQQNAAIFYGIYLPLVNKKVSPEWFNWSELDQMCVIATATPDLIKKVTIEANLIKNMSDSDLLNRPWAIVELKERHKND